MLKKLCRGVLRLQTRMNSVGHMEMKSMSWPSLLLPIQYRCLCGQHHPHQKSEVLHQSQTLDHQSPERAHQKKRKKKRAFKEEDRELLRSGQKQRKIKIRDNKEMCGQE